MLGHERPIAVEDAVDYAGVRVNGRVDRIDVDEIAGRFAVIDYKGTVSAEYAAAMGDDAEAAMRNLEEATAANPAWSSLSAVQNGRYITLDPTLYLSKPNAHWSDAYQGLFDSLYGQPARG